MGCRAGRDERGWESVRQGTHMGMGVLFFRTQEFSLGQWPLSTAQPFTEAPEAEEAFFFILIEVWLIFNFVLVSAL